MMWKYQIKKHYVKDNKDLSKVLNKYGKDGWDIFHLYRYNKRKYIDKRGFYQFETEYEIYMKKIY